MIFFITLGNHFIAAGDYNAKHMHWGLRLILSKGELLKVIEAINLTTLSTRELTYWLSENKKIADLLDLGIIKGIRKDYCHTESSNYPQTTFS